MHRYKNNHVSPAELEDVLQSHPAVLESLVFGLPDPHVQELFSAAVVLKPGHTHVRLVIIFFAVCCRLPFFAKKGEKFVELWHYPVSTYAMHGNS